MEPLQLIEMLGSKSSVSLQMKTIGKIDASLISNNELMKSAVVENDFGFIVEQLSILYPIRCYISSPNKDGEIPKDGNRPNDDDVPTENKPPLQDAG